MRVVMAIGAMLALAGCAHLPFERRALPGGGETISYSLRGSIMCRHCATFAITLGPDGQGIFDGRFNTAVSGERRFYATPEQVRAFTQALARVRPSDRKGVVPQTVKCEGAATDAPGVLVRWQGVDGATLLDFNYGCFGKAAEKAAEVLNDAPGFLPIADLIGRPLPPG